MIVTMVMPGLPEMGIILLVLVFMFGGKQIPKLAKGIGQSIKEFKLAKREIEDSIDEGEKLGRKLLK